MVGTSPFTVYPGPPSCVFDRAPALDTKSLTAGARAGRRRSFCRARKTKLFTDAGWWPRRASIAMSLQLVCMATVYCFVGSIVSVGAAQGRLVGCAGALENVALVVGRVAAAVVAVRQLEDDEEDDERDEEQREVADRAVALLALLRLLHRLPAGVTVLALALAFGRPWARRGSLPTWNPEPGSGGPPGTIARREPARAEVRRHVRRRPRPDPRRGGAHRAHPPRRRRRRGRRLGDGQDHRRPRAAGPRGVARPDRPRDGHAAHLGRAHLDRAACAWPSSTGARRRSRSPAPRPGSSPTPPTARPRSWRSAATACARRWPTATSRSSPASRASPPSGPSPPSAAAAPTPPRSRWRPPSRPTSARSTPTSPGCTPPIPASCPTPVGWSACPTTRCWRCRRPAGGCSRSGRSSSRGTTACRSTCGRASRGRPAPG